MKRAVSEGRRLHVRPRVHVGAQARDQDARIALDELDQLWLPVDEHWRLNERHYGGAAGARQGGDGREARRGAGQDLAPQLRHPAAAADARRRALPGARSPLRGTEARARLPLTESLKDTVARFLPYWHETIAPAINSGKRVLIAAHGNSLRALVKYLDDVGEPDIVELNIPTGIPLVYELDDNLKPIRHYYLGDPDAAAAAAAARRQSGQGAVPEIKKGRARRQTSRSLEPVTQYALSRIRIYSTSFPAFRPRRCGASAGSACRSR